GKGNELIADVVKGFFIQGHLAAGEVNYSHVIGGSFRARAQKLGCHWWASCRSRGSKGNLRQGGGKQERLSSPLPESGNGAKLVWTRTGLLQLPNGGLRGRRRARAEDRPLARIGTDRQALTVAGT